MEAKRAGCEDEEGRADSDEGFIKCELINSGQSEFDPMFCREALKLFLPNPTFVAGGRDEMGELMLVGF